MGTAGMDVDTGGIGIRSNTPYRQSLSSILKAKKANRKPFLSLFFFQISFLKFYFLGWQRSAKLSCADPLVTRFVPSVAAMR
jgi:hypothetical protein